MSSDKMGTKIPIKNHHRPEYPLSWASWAVTKAIPINTGYIKIISIRMQHVFFCRKATKGIREIKVYLKLSHQLYLSILFLSTIAELKSSTVIPVISQPIQSPCRA